MVTVASTSIQRVRLSVAVVASGSLLIGFAIAFVLGWRAVGGVILLLGGAWCAWRLVIFAGWWRMAVVAVVYIASFVLSHPLGNIIGSWPAVILVSLISGFVAYFAVPSRL